MKNLTLIFLTLCFCLSNVQVSMECVTNRKSKKTPQEVKQLKKIKRLKRIVGGRIPCLSKARKILDRLEKTLEKDKFLTILKKLRKINKYYNSSKEIIKIAYQDVYSENFDIFQNLLLNDFNGLIIATARKILFNSVTRKRKSVEDLFTELNEEMKSEKARLDQLKSEYPHESFPRGLNYEASYFSFNDTLDLFFQEDFYGRLIHPNNPHRNHKII